MSEPPLLLTFAVASITLILVPGPNLVYIVTHSMSRGLRAGLASAVGVEIGTLVYVLATALGVSGVIARSDLAFSVLKYAGAGYLTYLALRVVQNPPAVTLSAGVVAKSPWRACRDGAIVNLLNPKVGLFFLAFLPQFVETGPAAAPAATQLTVLGLVFLALAFVLDVAYAIAAGLAGSLIRTKGGEITWLRWPVVCIYVGLAAYAVVA